MSKQMPSDAREGTTSDRTDGKAALSPDTDVGASIARLLAALRDGTDKMRRDPAKSLANAGQEAVPGLIEAMKDDDARRFAASALRRLGPKAACAVPGLVEMLRTSGDRSVRCHAAGVLCVLGPGVRDAVSALVAALDNDELDVRRIAAEALGNIGEAANDAGPVLLAAVRCDDPTLRANAALALGRVGAASADIVPDLIELLRCDDRSVRSTAAQAVGDLGDVARAAIPALISALKGADGDFCYCAIEALGKFGPDAKDAVPLLGEAANDECYEIACSAIETLGKIGRDARNAVPALAKALAHDELVVGRAAAELLGSLGADAKDAVPALIKELTIEDCEHGEEEAEMDQAEPEEWEETKFRRLVAEALGKIGPDAREAVPALIDLLTDEDDDIRRTAAGSLGAIGPDALDAVPTLTHMVESSFVPRGESEEPALLRMEDDPDQPNEFVDRDATYCRRAAALALGRIGPAAKASAPSLINALKDDDCDVRATAVWALGKIGPVMDGVIQALIEALHDPHCDVHEAAERALSSVGVKAPTETISLLLEVTPRDNDSLARYGAFAALGRIGLPAVPGLIEALKSPSRETRRLAARELTYIKPPAIEAVPALTKALEEQDAGVREAAVDALQQINQTTVATR